MNAAHGINTILASVLRQVLCLVILFSAPSFAFAQPLQPDPVLLKAARVFDGQTLRTDAAVLLKDGKVFKIGPLSSFKDADARTLDLGDATLLPGFIELHAHLSYRHVPESAVLKHGITTLRDVGGPLHPPYGGSGHLRVLTSGPILTAPHGYPIAVMGAKDIAIAIHNEDEARKAVRQLIDGGAVVIKVALEPGGEPGAPWSAHHSHGPRHGHPQPPETGHAPVPHQPPHSAHQKKSAWPLLSESVVKAIVDEAHHNDRQVTAHVGEEHGVRIALLAGVDEWAHMPCNAIPEPLLQQAVAQNVTIVSTFDTLSKCSGMAHNAALWKSLGGKLLYGAEIAHPDIPWGIDAQELLYLMQMGSLDAMEVLRTATSKAGKHLGLPLLGTLQPGAPADLIAVKGNPLHNLKILEYPDMVISGGHFVVNDF